MTVSGEWSSPAIQRACRAAIAVAVLALPGMASAESISGTVFEDFNADGLMTVSAKPGAGDIGIGGVAVAAFGDGSAPVSTAATGASGTYSLTGLTPGTRYRIEFTLPSGSPFTPGRLPQSPPPAGATANGTSVQFRSVGEVANFAILQPSQYCQDNPLLATQCYFSPQRGPNVTSDFESEPTLKLFPASASGDTFGAGNAPNPNATIPTGVVPFKAIGATWGLAYQSRARRLYAGAFTKRLTTFGPGGPGAIYRIDPVTGASALFVDLNALGGASAGGADPHEPLPVLPSIDFGWVDATAYDAVGKTGLGDVDISVDGSALYAVGLAARALYEIPIDPASGQRTAEAVSVTPTPAPADCPAGHARPFGLGVRGARVYLGLVCDGPGAGRDGDQSQVRAYVYEYHPATKSFGLQVLNFSLTSPSLDATRGSGGGLSFAWQPWTPAGTIGSTQTLPQPMLSDLTFDDAGNMILAFRDRYADQQGAPDAPTAGGATNGLYIGEGDLMHACKTASGWSIEGGVDCGPPAGEFFSGDDNPNPAEGFEQETGTGGAVVVPGRGEVSSTVIDPFGCLGIGVSTWSVSGGAPTRRYEIGDDYFDRSIPCSAQGGTNTFYKANGIGDLEEMCDAAPLEIGNYVWLDSDRDGIQDPSEAPLSGVTVQLLDANGILLASATSASDGSYRFPIAPGTAYTVAIPLGQAALAGLAPTRTDASGAPGATTRDSNGATSGTNDIAKVVAHDPGNSDHTFDFGFVADTRPGPGTADLWLTKAANKTKVAAGGRVTFTLEILSRGTATAINVKVCDDLPEGMAFDPRPARARFRNGIACWSLGDLPPGAKRRIVFTVNIASSVSGKLKNVARSTADNAPPRSAARRVLVKKKVEGKKKSGVTG